MEPQVQVSPAAADSTVVDASVVPTATEGSKKNSSLTIILIAVAVVLIGLGIGAYFVFTNKDGSVYRAIFGEPEETESDTEDTGDAGADGENEEDQGDTGDEDAEEEDDDDPYADWETYIETTCDVTLRYPSDWVVDDSENASMGLVKISKDNYVWEFGREPIVTGGGFGYMIEMVGPSAVDEVAVSPDSYDSTIVSNYVSRADLIAAYDPSIVSAYNIQANTWEGSVLFTDPDDNLLGFGPGEMYTDVNCDWFDISYMYDYQQADFSDLPVRGNATLNSMLDTMNLITNSVEL